MDAKSLSLRDVKWNADVDRILSDFARSLIGILVITKTLYRKETNLCGLHKIIPKCVEFAKMFI